MRLRFGVFLLLLVGLKGFAHTELPDTVHLDEVVFFGDKKKYQPGSKIVKLTETQLQTSQEGGIEQLLMRFTPVYIKTNAGGLSTIKVRGTSASHTTINFGGININSLTLGHSNMSAIPTFFFDKFELQYGGSSALNGSGAIGGAIYLGQNNRWTNGVNVDTKVSLGSFGEQFYGAKLFMGNGRFESVTRAYSLEKENNFPFKNKYTGNVEDTKPVNDIQKGAALKNFGVIQEINYLFSENEHIKTSVWANHNWQQIQPTMQVNLDFKQAEEILDENLRLWGEYKNDENQFKTSIGAGYVHDFQWYNNTADQKIITDRLVSEATVKRIFNKKLETKIGAKYQYIVPNVYSYSKQTIDNEQHFDLFGTLFIQPFKHLKTAINLRQQLVTNYKAPFTPSVGADYVLIDNNTTMLSTGANASRSYRIPTLNDRFWGNQGNPNLKPEDGINLEWSFAYNYCTEKGSLQAKLNAFYMDIDNWIEWRNFGVWQAQNVQRVVSKGAEIQLGSTFEIAGAKSEFNLNYTLNSAKAIESSNGTGTTQHQLTYTPVHLANASYFLHYRNNTFSIDGNYTGQRFANYSGTKLKPYFLTNITYFRQFDLWGQKLKANLSVNNLFNVQYENERYYAMPGINFRAGIIAELKYSNNK